MNIDNIVKSRIGFYGFQAISPLFGYTFIQFIYDDTDSTYEELLTKSKLPTLKIRRIRTIAIETLKTVNKKEGTVSTIYMNIDNIVKSRIGFYGFQAIC
jgi:hypothetical protein